MKICFYGVGGVGGYFGALVAQRFAAQHDIFFVARGSHKNAICQNGLTLKKAGGAEILNVSPMLCTDTVADLPVCDIIILSVKSYDLANAAKDICKIADAKTIVLPLLNGVDIYERIREHFTTGIVLPSCVYVGTHIESPGVIYQKGGNCKILFGVDPQHSEVFPELLISLLTDSSIEFACEDDVKESIWSKYMFIAAYGLVTATYNKTLGEILADDDLCETTKLIMTETEQIAKRLGVALRDDIVDVSFLKAKQFPAEAKTSFQRDIESKGSINEGDLFGGTLIRYGEMLDIPTPTVKSTYEKLMQKLALR